MEIIKTANENYTAKELYKFTKSTEIVKLRSYENQKLNVTGWVLYTDNDMEILSLQVNDNEYCATNSPTFIKNFLDIYDLAKELPLEILVKTGTSKAGRQYVTAEWV